MGLYDRPPATTILPLVIIFLLLLGAGLASGGAPTRRRIVGSSPPTCRSKCGRCAPCRPVHVPVHPGTSVPLEYYPEAWRCKCGSSLFMP